MEQLVRLYLISIRALLLATGLPEVDVKRVLEGIFSGSTSVERECAVLLARRGLAAPASTADLPALVGRLARVTPLLGRPTAEVETLDATVAVMRDAGDTSLRLGIPPMAYNFFEIAWHIGGIIDRAALDIAERLGANADPDNVEQYHGAIWRLAIEQLRRAFDTQSDYQPALGTLELALTCRVPNPGLQVDLFHRLQQQVKRGRGTRVEDLVAIVAAQVPATVWDADKRRLAQRALAELRLGERAHRLHPDAVELFAVTEAQIMLDDLQLSLAPREEQAVQINWHDLRFRDSRLASAVPMGRSLIADPARSAVLLLDLAHEIGHALALQGPIGMRQASYRAAINYSEMLLLDLAGRKSSSNGAVQPALTALPNHLYGRALAATQLDAAAMAAIERAVWRPWLEGLSMYVEMLADPSDDVDQISVLHTSIRSLIDFDIPRKHSESSDDYAERFAAEANRQFEGFYSAALKARSRVQHLAYLDDGDGARRAASDLYVLGYLQVRTVVAAWEATLGRRIAPTLAARLLFTSTMAGAFKFYDGIGAIADMSVGALCERYCGWLELLAALPADRLAEFFTPTGRDQPGVAWTWADELRRIDTDPATADRTHAARMDALEQDTLLLAHIDVSSSDEATAAHAEMLRLLLKSYMQDNALLPIGACASKLLFLEAPGRIGLGVRTYASHAAPATPNPAAPGRHDPRYNYRFWTLPGGDAEAEKLRRVCGRAGSARLSVSRIIDLAGRPDLPFALRGTSYLCGFLGADFAVVLPWGTDKDVARDNPAFVETLRHRLLPPFGIADEASTTANLAFLAKRVLTLDPSDIGANAAISLDIVGLALRVGYAGVARAVSTTVDVFASIYAETMKHSACRRAMARVLHSTGRGTASGEEPDLVDKRLVELLIDTSSFSGVKPFGGK